MPRHAQRALLHDVACTAAGECVSVGYFAAASGYWYSLVEAQRGPSWHLVPTPNRPAAIASVLSGVSCTAATRCVTVGNWTDRSEVQLPLVEAWNGARWSISAPPLPSGAASGMLTGVRCLSASWCTAAGSYLARNHDLDTLIEHWDGSSWRPERSPDASGATASTFASVSCSSTSSCVAVGFSVSPSGATTSLAEAWDGRTWRITPTVNPPGRATRAWVELDAVSCPRTTVCVATGDLGLSNADPYVALAEVWNGRRWTLSDPVRPRGTSKSPLTGVSCPTSRSCTAVGFRAGRTGTTTLAEIWNGSVWKAEPTPNQASVSASQLYDVACSSTSACTADGDAGTGGFVHPLAETSSP